MVELKKMPKAFEKSEWVSAKNLAKFAFPKTINSFLTDQNN